MGKQNLGRVSLTMMSALMAMDPLMMSALPAPLKEKEPKNKYGLTPEEVDLLKDMTPKEKKQFFKNRGKDNV